MKIRLRAMTSCLLAAAALAGPAAAQQARPMTGVLGMRESLQAVFDGMPTPHLQALFLRCARESSERMFGMDEAVPCAMAWDALLKREFGGDVAALLQWWRAHREEAPAS